MTSFISFFCVLIAVAGWAQAQLPTVLIVSEPIGATVWVDTNYCGKTPIEIPVTPDRWTRVILTLNGYRSVAESVNVSGSTRCSLLVALTPCCDLLIRSIPPKAALVVDDSAMGGTDRLIPQLPLGSHRFLLRQHGYNDTSFAASFSTAEPCSLSIRMRPRFSPVRFLGNPPGASVSIIAGESLGVMPIPGCEMQWGTHELIVTKPGYIRRTISLTIDSDSAQTVDVSLQKASRLTAAFYSALYPGIGQAYSGRKGAGHAFLAAEVLADLGLAFTCFIYYNETNILDSIRGKYLAEKNYLKIRELHDDLKTAYENADKRYVWMRAVFVGACLLRLYSAADAYYNLPHDSKTSHVNVKSSLLDGRPSIMVYYSVPLP